MIKIKIVPKQPKILIKLFLRNFDKIFMYLNDNESKFNHFFYFKSMLAELIQYLIPVLFLGPSLNTWPR